MPRLTKLEKDAILDILSERLAGCPDDLKDAMGLTTRKEAEQMWKRLVSANNKLYASIQKIEK